ncbi:MAG: 30S ribosomal protein S20 [candidate division Zixibacteria bacterium]|nr:30S ribosomal protein S20 [candidate division Zixibacteria bacterium]
MKTSAEGRLRNRAIRTQIKNAIKDLRACKTRAEADSKLTAAISVVDKASQRNILHRNKAGRIKSQLNIFVNRLSS